MAEVLNAAVDSNLELNTDNTLDSTSFDLKSPSASSPPPPQPAPQQPPARRERERERDFRERRDDRDFDRRGRDYYDRNRSPPPPLPPRDRDFKRSRPGSFSPPPPLYRDRRGGGHSPPPRRSPPYPPYKRSRRDDYDGRRGGHRGAYGRGDRRFYNQSGYERGLGGRPNHQDERLPGRSFGRWSGGFQDRDYNRGGMGDGITEGTTQREGLMSYKQFIQELEDDILPSEAERRYQEYKTEYISTQKKTYFGAHKDEEWLKDKYHPTNLLTVIERRNEAARNLAKDFQSDLYAGTLDIGPALDPSLANKSILSSDPNNGEVDDGSTRRQHAKASARDTDLLSASPKAHPVSSDPRRIQIDIGQALELVRKLDSEKGVEGNLLCHADNDRMNKDKSGPVIIVRGLGSVKGLEGIELLDTLLTYLWRIHGVDYYGLFESNEAKGLRHIRADSKKADAAGSGAEWEKKLDLCWQQRLKGRDPLEVMAAKEKIDAAAVEALDPYVRKIRDEKYGWKYGCGAKGCTKLFHAAEFVHKHLKLKHSELASEATTKVREDLYFQNYMSDENAPGGTPVMQPSLPKEKPMRRRHGLEDRLKDERGARQGRDNRASERVDGPENPQPGDFLSHKDGAPGGNSDEQMYDSLGGQGISIAPFSSDMTPPPVLMPVPGAGPLGPFVPAPPEVAMRMLREQGGSPFEGGMNGLPGSQLTGTTPIIALPPQFRQDPRRLRSYQDLDAPEDEVTVIDYRSL